MTKMENNINPEEYGLTVEKAQSMTKEIDVIVTERNQLRTSYDEIVRKEINDETIKEARELRLKIRDNRTKGIVAWHKANKAFYLAGGRFVDAIKNKEEAENKRIEENLLSIEEHFIRIEQERIDKLNKERLLIVNEFVNELDIVPSNIGEMSSEAWENYLKSIKLTHKARIEQQQKEQELRVKEELKELTFRKRLRYEFQSKYAKLFPINLTIDTTEAEWLKMVSEVESKGRDEEKRVEELKAKEAKLKQINSEQRKKKSKRVDESDKFMLLRSELKKITTSYKFQDDKNIKKFESIKEQLLLIVNSI